MTDTPQTQNTDLAPTCSGSPFCSGTANLGTSPGTVGMKNGADWGTLGGSFGLFFFCEEKNEEIKD